MASKNDRLDEKLAICAGLGMTAQEAADFCQVTRNTYYNRTAKITSPFEELRSFAAAAAEKTLSLRIASTKAAQSAEEKIVSRLDQSLAITDKVIKALTDDTAGRCESCGRIEPQTIKELLSGQKAITQWISKFAASEAPKRLQVEGAVEHTHKMVSDDLVQRLEAVILSEQRQIAGEVVEGEAVQ